MSELLSQLAGDQSLLAAQLLTRSLRLLVILAVAVASYMLLRYLTRILSMTIQRLDDSIDSEFDLRTKTILRFVRSVGLIVIVAVTMLSMLHELGINIAPLLASVGVAGLALGLGAQTLVKDAIAGLFLLLEDQFAVGDSIDVNGLSGTVEELKLRTTHMRDLRGTLHIIPNGDIRMVSNHTNGWSRAVIDIMIPYHEDVDVVLETLNEVCTRVSDMPVVGDMLTEKLSVSGVDGFNDKGMMFRVLGKVEPGEQWALKRHLRQAIHRAFQAKNIQFGVPTQQLYMYQYADAQPPFYIHGDHSHGSNGSQYPLKVTLRESDRPRRARDSAESK